MSTSTSSGSTDAARLQRLEDIDSIHRLKAAYCAACDDDHNGDAVAQLFVPDGTWKATVGGDCAGHDEIRQHFGGIRASGVMRYSTHMVTNPVISIDGDHATGSWSFMMMFTDQAETRIRILGFYRDEYERTADGWRFRSLLADVQDYVALAATDPRP